MSFSTTGTLSGTPTTAGTYTFVIRVDAGGYWDEVEVEFEVVSPTKYALMVNVLGGTLRSSNSLNGTAVSSFQICQYEATWAEWKHVRAWAVANGYDLGGTGNALGDFHPVHSMTWQHVLKWLNAKSEMDGLVPVYRSGGAVYKTGLVIPTTLQGANGYRLPTEAEWEWACRGGALSQNYTYSGSNDLEEVAWYQANNTPQGTKVVGQKKPNELGLYDMAGNSWEYCWDLVSEGRRRIRGGGCWDTPNLMAYRWDADISQPWVNFGFRYVRNAVGEMVSIKGGTLPAGSELAGKVVSNFYIGRTEVTLEEWSKTRDSALKIGYTDLANTGNATASNHPVGNVSWYDILKWCNAKSELEGLTPVYSVNGTIYRTGDFASYGSKVISSNATANGYRLPVEAEWEWASRGGNQSKSYTYSGSSDLASVAWYSVNAQGGTKPVATKIANELGLHDMSGNVWEWVLDEFTNDTTGIRRKRGGSWSSNSSDCTVAFRYVHNYPNARYPDMGFRLARNFDQAQLSALHFRNTSDALRISGSTVLDTTLTIEAIVKLDQNQVLGSDLNQPISNVYVEDWVGQGSMGQKNFGISTSGIMGFVAPNYLGQAMTQKIMDISKNEWHHAAYVVDSSSERLYLNGSLVATRASQNQNVWETTTSSFLGYGWLGYLSSFRISNVARYSGASYTVPNRKLANDSSTLMLFNFTSASGTTVFDESGNGRHGTLGGSTPRAASPTEPVLVVVE
jgi:formylglycine-generating enzyme required for sulfatase activity